MLGAISSQTVKASEIKAGYTTAERILNIEAIKILSVNIIVKLDIAKIPNIKANVFFLSYFENKMGMNNPLTAIVNVNELTYNPEIEIDVLKYPDICEMIPIILKGVFIPKVDNIKIYKSNFGLYFIFSIPLITIVM